MTEVDVVILAYTADESIFQMNEKAVRTLVEGNPAIKFNVFLLESSPAAQANAYGYPHGTQVIFPERKFNFNAFNNYGMRLGKAPWVLFTNNDVEFGEGCITHMLAAHAENPALRCLCPVDPHSPHTPAGFFPKERFYVEGYHVRTTFTGWCFLVKRDVFDVTGPFDERFDYYFADDDFTMAMRRFDIRNAAVPSAYAKHLAHVTSKKVSLDISQKFKEDQALFKEKWGAQRIIAWKNRLTAYFLRPLGWKGIIRQLYRPKWS